MAVTIREIAKLTDCSPTAVSFVLNGKDAGRVSAEKRAAILEAVKKYRYRRNPAAHGLTTRRVFRVGLCMVAAADTHPVLGRFSRYEHVALVSRALHEHAEIVPVRTEDEGCSVTLEQYDAAAIRLTGNVQGSPPYTGALRHRGWRAKSLRLPQTLKEHDPAVLAPAEVEL